jgi:hypothetical protein
LFSESPTGHEIASPASDPSGSTKLAPDEHPLSLLEHPPDVSDIRDIGIQPLYKSTESPSSTPTLDFRYERCTVDASSNANPPSLDQRNVTAVDLSEQRPLPVSLLECRNAPPCHPESVENKCPRSAVITETSFDEDAASNVDNQPLCESLSSTYSLRPDDRHDRRPTANKFDDSGSTSDVDRQPLCGPPRPASFTPAVDNCYDLHETDTPGEYTLTLRSFCELRRLSSAVGWNPRPSSYDPPLDFEIPPEDGPSFDVTLTFFERYCSTLEHPPDPSDDEYRQTVFLLMEHFKMHGVRDVDIQLLKFASNDPALDVRSDRRRTTDTLYDPGGAQYPESGSADSTPPF